IARRRASCVSTCSRRNSPTRATNAPSRCCSTAAASRTQRSAPSRRSSTISISRTASSGEPRSRVSEPLWRGSAPRPGMIRSGLHAGPKSSTTSTSTSGRNADKHARANEPTREFAQRMRHTLADLSIAEQWKPQHGVSLREAFWTWFRVAGLSFGGPAGQIAVMHRILVEEKRWISEQRFLHALNYCMLLPGPEAQQLATYIGWLMHRTLGGIIAGGLFVVPGIIAIMALSYVYAGWGNVPVIVALFFGLKAAVLAIVVEAVVRIGKRALKNRVMI